MKILDKSHDTGLRILEVLKILLNEDTDKQTIIEKLKDNNEIGNAYTHEAYLKYFNTLEALGLNIEKTETGYSLRNALMKIDLTPKEEKLLNKIIKTIPTLHDKQQEDTVKNLIIKIDKFVKHDLRQVLKKIEEEPSRDNLNLNIVNTIKHMMAENSEITITYKKNNGNIDTLDVTVKKIKEENNHYYVLCFNSSMQRCKRICVDSIISIKQSPKRANNIDINTTVIFEVYGRLSKSYKLKEWEKLDDFGNGYMRISNTQEDFESLLPRLLKYGENCKIISPINIIEDFLSLTNDILHNLGEKACQE